jgi:Fe-S-cluster containining protein
LNVRAFQFTFNVENKVMNKFPCSSCGACCRRIKFAVEHFKAKNEKDPLYFPYKWDEKGVCENLTEDNQCKVYENRPLICNVEKYAEFAKLDKDNFYRSNILACNYMMDMDNVPLHFRIK